jgi:hypothetical protein
MKPHEAISRYLVYLQTWPSEFLEKRPSDSHVGYPLRVTRDSEQHTFERRSPECPQRLRRNLKRVRTYTVRHVPEDFPREPYDTLLAGSQPKFALRSVDGKYRVGLTNEELLERYDACEDLA